uniref:LAGLIDADG homing endonuclease n=1 Tax=Marophrys sp. SRT127 TaxID=2488311 RepID=A0A455REI7_9EUKA|nr:hypothetical protein [Marophrys sp. SRT127]BBH42975.1 LAGLIDADG homing endonuclease [Marophrys sp. SRT127]
MCFFLRHIQKLHCPTQAECGVQLPRPPLYTHNMRNAIINWKNNYVKQYQNHLSLVKADPKFVATLGFLFAECMHQVLSPGMSWVQKFQIYAKSCIPFLYPFYLNAKFYTSFTFTNFGFSRTLAYFIALLVPLGDKLAAKTTAETRVRRSWPA